MLKGSLMLIRLLWLVSIATGVVLYFRPGLLPVNIHMYIGFAIALLMIVVGVIGLRVAAGISVVTILVAISLPVVGILQLAHLGRPDLPYIQITHVVLGLAAIAVAEITGKRVRLAA